jgi:hypothetical protein
VSDDRTVHGHSMNRLEPWEVVRYDRSGKWYLESPDGRRQHVGVHHAAKVAADGNFTPGLPGGRTFDRLVREKRRSVKT